LQNTCDGILGFLDRPLDVSQAGDAARRDLHRAASRLHLLDKGRIIRPLASVARQVDKVPCAVLGHPRRDGAAQPAQPAYKQVRGVWPQTQAVITAGGRQHGVVRGETNDELAHVLAFLHVPHGRLDVDGLEELDGPYGLDSAEADVLHGPFQQLLDHRGPLLGNL
jgi:hypothetical protein